MKTLSRAYPESKRNDVEVDVNTAAADAAKK